MKMFHRLFGAKKAKAPAAVPSQAKKEQLQGEKLSQNLLFQAMHGGYAIFLTPVNPDGRQLVCVRRASSREQCVDWLAQILLGRGEFYGVKKDGQMLSGSECEQLLSDANARADEIALRSPSLDLRKRRERINKNEPRSVPRANPHEFNDRNQVEPVKVAEAARTDDLIKEGIANFDQLNALKKQPVALAQVMRGIADLVGRVALTQTRPGEQVLDLVSERSGFADGGFATPKEWIRALSAHLAQMETAAGAKVINAGSDVIEATFYALRQLGDFRQALLETQMIYDGTQRKFNEEYLNDLKSKTPMGLHTLLNKYARTQAESDVLQATFKALYPEIDRLILKKANLDAAVQFLNEHDLNPDFRDFGRAVAEYTGATSMEHTEAGTVVEYRHPLTGDAIPVDYGIEKGETQENIQRLKQLALAGLEYAACPNSEALKAAYWTDFAKWIDNYLLNRRSSKMQIPSN